MARTVTVALKAYTGQYRKEVGDAAKATDKLGDSIDDVGQAGRRAGRNLDEVAKHADRLDGQIKQTEASVRQLAVAFAATGDPKIITQLRAQQRELTNLAKVRKLLGDEQQSQTLADSIRSGLQKVSPAAAGIGAFGASMTPLLGGLIAGAVVGGVGIGGIAGGIALAARSPVIKARAEDLGRTVLGGLSAQAQRALGGPLLESMDELERTAARTVPRIGQIFDDLAPSLLPLTRDLGRGAEGLLEGVADVAATSGPVLKELGDLLGDLGESLGGLLTVLSEHPEAAAWAVKHLNGTVTDLLSTVGAGMSILLTVGDAIAAIEKTTSGWAESNGFVAGTLTALENALMGPIGAIADLWQAWNSSTDEGKKAAAVARENAAAAAVLEDQEQALKRAQEELTSAQRDLTAAMDSLNPAGDRARQTVDGLKTAVDRLYGAQMRQVDANEAYEASWDGLSDSVKKNKGTLDIHTAAGRANRDALQDLLTSSRELYLADIEAGKSTAEATAKHRERTKAVEKEANRLGLNKKITGELIGTYGQIPPRKTTQLIVDGVDKVANALFELTVLQYALAKGIPEQSARAILTPGNKGPHNRQQGDGYGYAAGGRLPGAPSSVDNLTGVGPGGQVFGLAGGEYIVNAKQTAKHLPLLAAINEGADGYASGGYFPAMDTSRTWPFTATADRAYVMSEATARSKVIPAGPEGGATAPWIVAAIRKNFPDVDIVSVFRKGARTLSGNRSYHGMNRAVDTEPSEALARWFYSNYKARLKEQITPWQRYNVHNGKSHTYTGAVWAQHNFAGGNAHNHIAMAGGGVIGEPVFGVGASGRTYSFGEVGPERVTPMRGYASGGLVNIAPSSTTTTSVGGGSRLDYLSALLAARDAVASLTASLKENGRTWASNTAKGRANRQSLISGVRAAQAAAEARYAETGSIRAANKVYDEYIKKLNASMKAMGVNAKTRRALLKAYGEKPQYDVPDAPAKSPSNSSGRVRSITDQIAAEEQIATIRQAFAWTKPTFSTKTEAGRAELTTLFGFLSAAEQAAQSLYAEGGNAAASMRLYSTYIAQLRTVLSRSGMTKAQIDSLLKQYGRITLARNRWGGVYQAASGGLREAQIAAGGPTMYAWAEPETGGEAFIPRNGNRARSTAIWQHVGQNWLGQSPGGRSGPITVMATIPITLGADTITRQVRLEVDASIGRVVDAVVYQSA